ncbi:transposase, partial [Nitrosomonas sp.]|uniref:transposase n=1 Tax=Nitrosomonas sp. TaxID=42353 RepID=UPI0025F0B704
LLQQIELQHPNAHRIYVICDNARYYRSQIVAEYLSDSKIELIFLPPYAPNLNLIERYKESLRSLLIDNFQIIDCV